ncbi:MAG: sortase domain-bontaining protein [Gaiellaceae bacterium]
MRAASRVAWLACAAAVLALPSASFGADPPNPNDPCSTGGRNTCGTLGVGYYKTYRYGIRWFGDFRGVVPGEAHAFCIDLRFWYPSPSYRFREGPGTVLRNRENEIVPVERQRRMAYAVWQYGRSTAADQQAAVMLYVHSLMGDARPGEVDPAALSPAVAELHARIARDAARYHGPYRIEARVADSLLAGREGTATIRVLSARGEPVPNVALDLSAPGARMPEGARTDGAGVARVTFTPTSAAALRLSVKAQGIASTLPRIFSPSVAPAARNGQRLVVPGSQTVTALVTAPVAKARLAVSTVAVPDRVAVGEASRDRVTISGALPSWRATVSVRVHGPFPSAAAIRCDGRPAWTGSFGAAGSGAYTTPPATFDEVGWYAYVEVVPGDASHIGLTTPCRVPSELFRVEAQPRVRTIVSAARVEPGTEIHDRVLVEGLAGQRAVVHASLYGPFGTREAIACDGKAVWTGSIEVQGDGDYQTEPVKLTVPGFYTYTERIDAGGFVRAVQTPCGEVTETTVVIGKPQLTTTVSDQTTRPGARITDRVVVTGLGALSVQVRVLLWGPFASKGGIRCSGTPYWTGTFVVEGDGTYTTSPVLIRRAGYYTYQESIVEGPANAAFTTRCGEASETTFAQAAPAVTTIVSEEVVLPGSRIFDRIRVSGLGRTPAAIDVELHGPFASQAAIRCDGRPYWRGRVFAQGDGEIRSPRVPVARVGFYTYRERLVGSAVTREFETECGLASETSLAAPRILTGRGEVTRHVAVPRPGRLNPTRVQVDAIGIDAAVSPVGIDLRAGALQVPSNILRTGWWYDGMAPGARSGSILITGHVDSARFGRGAFFRLREARIGARVRVTNAAGRTFAYRVVSTRSYPKSELPTRIYFRQGTPRLVLVTCGGPFDEASGRYRDNVVVTAVPA